MYGHLRHVRQLVFDGILDRYDFFGFGVPALETRVQRRGFPATGRAGHEDHAMWSSSERFERSERVRAYSQLVQLHGAPPTVEEPEHDALAKDRWDARNAQ